MGGDCCDARKALDESLLLLALFVVVDVDDCRLVLLLAAAV